jgi:hypothetical protein
MRIRTASRNELRPRVKKCVRCGQLPRHHQTYMCSLCLAAELTNKELVWAVERENMTDDEQRQVLVNTYGWAGGWTRKI